MNKKQFYRLPPPGVDSSKLSGVLIVIEAWIHPDDLLR